MLLDRSSPPSELLKCLPSSGALSVQKSRASVGGILLLLLLPPLETDVTLFGAERSQACTTPTPSSTYLHHHLPSPSTALCTIDTTAADGRRYGCWRCLTCFRLIASSLVVP
jgi:hypothetical protein